MRKWWQSAMRIGTLIFDEAHVLTNRKSKRSKAAIFIAMRANRVIAAGLGHPGNIEYEKKAASLPPDILLALAEVVVKLTLPHRPITALAESDEASPGEGGLNGAQPDQILPPRLSS